MVLKGDERVYTRLFFLEEKKKQQSSASANRELIN